MINSSQDNNVGKLIIFSMIFVSGLLLSNIMGQKVIDVFGIVLTVGIFAYPVTFLMTDTISEVWGKDVAQKVVIGGFVANIIMVIGLYLSTLPAAIPDQYPFGEEYALILAGVPRITLASLAAYLVSQFVDVNLFHFIKKKTNGKHLWLRNNASTMVSQMLDTIVFIVVAFAGTMPVSAMISMMAAQYFIKFLFAMIDTPFVYILVNWAKGVRNTQGERSSAIG
ncbi:queuosine precursor transporter [Lentibacillus jeotgali]|uniref:queuosine precursor transporter n=1 Tax=Lentibacillus jeotgali TaxID=558169 RepID=UPI0002627029|nr:queuosine precursor transporter [Lentibacillus jeotgali]